MVSINHNLVSDATPAQLSPSSSRYSREDWLKEGILVGWVMTLSVISVLAIGGNISLAVDVINRNISSVLLQDEEELVDVNTELCNNNQNLSSFESSTDYLNCYIFKKYFSKNNAGN